MTGKAGFHQQNNDMPVFIIERPLVQTRITDTAWFIADTSKIRFSRLEGFSLYVIAEVLA